MRYVVAGYIVIVGLLFLYAVQLAWRRRRLRRAVDRVTAVASAGGAPMTDASGGGVATAPAGAVAGVANPAGGAA